MLDVKKIWGDGPWADEPDEWEATLDGFAARAVRKLPQGHWCGYLFIPAGHPWHGEFYDDIDAVVHGGLTYSRKHSTKADVWVVGFDCGHAFDFLPGARALMVEASKRFAAEQNIPEFIGAGRDDVYRDLPFVIKQLTNIAQQAKVQQKYSNRDRYYSAMRMNLRHNVAPEAGDS